MYTIPFTSSAKIIPSPKILTLLPHTIKGNYQRQQIKNPIQFLARNPKSLSYNHRRTTESLPSQTMADQNLVVTQQRTVIENKHGEKLVGVLHSTGSKEVVVLCHGFRSKKEDKTILNLIDALTRRGISAFHFDFSGNGESEGNFEYGNYHKEADDLHAVIQYLSKTHEISAILGHSKGGDVVLLYASIYHGVHTVINVSGRYDLKRGIDDRIGKDFMQQIKKDGFIDVKNKSGEVEYRVTEESLMDRLNTDMDAAARSIDKECRVLTVHGSADEIIPVEDALQFSKLIPNHELHIVEGANHCYSAHQQELVSIVLEFLKSNQVGDILHFYAREL